MTRTATNQVLVVGPLPDDEVPGCNATITWHADTGDQVQVLMVVEDPTSQQQERESSEDGGELSSLTQGGGTQLGFKVVDVSSLLRQLL